MHIYSLIDLFIRGLRESDQNKHPLRFRFVGVIGGAGFGYEYWGESKRVKMKVDLP